MGLLDGLFGGKRPDDTTSQTPSPAAPPAESAPSGNVVRLRPFVPIPVKRPWRSWLGGHPRVPDPFTWPEGDGKPFHFVAQIDCSELPAALWLGAGPRRGWLVFFVGTRKGYTASTVLHVERLGPERPAPGPWDAEVLQLYPLRDTPENWRHQPPCWPVEVLARRDADADEGGAPTPRVLKEVTLSRAEYLPHDWETLRILLHLMRKYAATRRDSLARSIDRLAGGEAAPPPERAAKVAAGRETLARVDAVIGAVAELTAEAAEAESRGAPYAWDDWRARMDAVLADSAACQAFDAVGVLRTWNELRAILMARAYTANPSDPALPGEALRYFLERWRNESARDMPAWEARAEATRMSSSPRTPARNSSSSYLTAACSGGRGAIRTASSSRSRSTRCGAATLAGLSRVSRTAPGSPPHGATE